MEATGLVRSEMHTPFQQDHRPIKRKRFSHQGLDYPARRCTVGSDSSRSREVGGVVDNGGSIQLLLQPSQVLENNTPRAQPLFGQTVSAASAYQTSTDTNAVHLHMDQAYRHPRLHDTSTDRSGHHYVPTIMPDRNPDSIAGSSVTSPGAISIASAQPATEDGFAPVSTSPSMDGNYPGNPIYHSQRWPDTEQQPGACCGAAHGGTLDSHHHHFQEAPQRDYHQFEGFVLPQQTHDLGSEFTTTVSASASAPHALGAADQSLPGSSEHLSLHHHRRQSQNQLHQQQQQHQDQHETAFFHTPQAFPAFTQAGSEAAVSSYQGASGALAAVPVPVSYTNQFESESGNSNVRHLQGDSISLNSGTYLHASMGGGEFAPGQRQVHVLGHGHDHDHGGGYSQAIDGHYGTQGSSVVTTMDHHVGLVASSSASLSTASPSPSLGPPQPQPPSHVNVSRQVYHHPQTRPPQQTIGGGDMLQHDSGCASIGASADSEASGTPRRPSIRSASSDAGLQNASEQTNSIKEERGSGASMAKNRRGPLDLDHRRKTAETRKRKACTRCRTQKMRCDVDPSDELGPCVGCKSFCKTSKKTLHLTPCFRGKITDVVLFRSGGLRLTSRWNGTEMKDVGDRMNPSDIRTIEFSQGLWRTSIMVRVVAFKPREGDVVARFWMLRDSDNDMRRKKDLAAYCLANIQETADYFENYVQTYAVDALIEQRTGPVKLAGQRPALLGVIEKTYMAAVKHYEHLKERIIEGSDSDVDREFNLLHNLFIFWFARRHTTGSAYISGKETLGMKPEIKDETYPLFGKVSLPRMVVAQFDSINNTRLLSRYSKKVLSELEALMMRNQPRWWFTIYICLFILLREASWLSEDRYRHARQNYGKKLRYSIPTFVESLHEGCNNLLQHWHYYNCKPWPDPNVPWERHKSFLSELSSENYDLVMETMMNSSVQKQLDIWRRYKSDNGHVEKPAAASVKEDETAYQGFQTHYDWDHPFYWISQLFEEQWRAHPTYQSE